MKKFCILPLIAALALFSSCQKQQTEEERNAEVERQVQQRLAAEKQEQERQQFALQQQQLDERDKALAAKEAGTATTAIATPARATQSTTTVRRSRDASEPRTSKSYGTFYRKLEPYGAWFETNDYGYVWQPQEAERSRTWRPYTDGHWVYTDAGWTWISEERFGWATYHYGRWVRLRNVGWVWVPGDEWAPAWVSWRTGGEYVGWAPLPPEARMERGRGIHNWADNYYDISPEQYAFVSVNELGASRLQRAVVPSERNVTIITQTTNVTNITYNNTMVVNQGPNYEEYRSRSQQPIERYRLERETTFSDDRPQPVVRGQVVAMSAPIIGEDVGYERPRNVKQRLAQAVVETGWAAITDRAAADSARAKMKSEATPPPDAPAKTFVKPTTSAAAASAPVESASAAAVSSPSATATAMATATATATPTPKPTAAPTAPATATPTPIVPASPSPSPTPTASPRSARFPSPTAAPSAESETSAPPQSSAAASASPTADSFTARDAKLHDQQLKHDMETARKQRDKQEHDAAKAAQQMKKDEFRNFKKRETEALSPSAPPTTATPAATEPATTPIPPAAALRAAPEPIVTPPPAEAATDTTRHSAEKKSPNARHGAPAAADAAATAAQRDAEPAATVTPSASPSPSPSPSATAPAAAGPAKEKKPKHGPRGPGAAQPESPATEESPAEPEVSPSASPPNE